jgi:2-keto-4-pentenoate hydratase/2-oxohepta-3-ene-1,7-dioic acid hydratase in catechol pathway
VPDYGDQVTLEQQPVDLAAVYRDGYAYHRHVAELRVSARYYPAAPKAPESPAPTPSSTWNGCFGGHNCPGG